MKALFVKNYYHFPLLSISVFNISLFPAFADVTRGLSEEEILNSAVKPVMTVTKELLQPDLELSPKQMKISVYISGADEKYASTGIHLFYDSRLTPERNERGKTIVNTGEAAEYLNMLLDEDNTKFPRA